MKNNVIDGGTAVHERNRSGFGQSDHDQREMQKKMEQNSSPGPGHKALEPFIGNWKAEVKSWMEPGGSPEVTQGTAKANWTLNGRFLEQEFNGEMMGKPFTGKTLMGFDNVKQTFNTFWVSDMQTSMFISEGRGENANKVLTLEGKAVCPATGRTDLPVKTVYRILSPDKHVFEMFDKSQGENAKTLEITYTRK